MSRGRELLRLAADALEDGRNPLDGTFLREHRVTADECFDLAEGMAAAIRFTDGFINLSQGKRRIRQEEVARLAAPQPGEQEEQSDES